MIRSYAAEHQVWPITVNTIFPGDTQTPIIEQNLEVIQGQGFTQVQVLKMMVNDNRHKWLRKVDEIAETAI